MILMRATSITRALGRGRALKIETFFYPEMATSEASAFWAKKSLFGCTLFSYAARYIYKLSYAAFNWATLHPI